jgi:type II secretory pathway pseudopilin PulG
MTQPTPCDVEKRDSELGFSLLEVVIASVILMVGLLSLLAVFSTALASTQSSQQDQIARQKAKEGLESVFTARTTGQISFDTIKNDVNGGIYQTGFQPLQAAGPDGLVGTTDDIAAPLCPGGVECVRLPGPDGILGTSDDVTLPISNYQRNIALVDMLNPDGTVNPNLRQITVTIQYSAPRQRTYAVTALISRYR